MLSQNFAAFLNSPIRKVLNIEPARYIQDRVNAVLATESPTVRDALKDQYTKDFMSYTVCAVKGPTLDLLLFEPNDWPCRSGDRTMTALHLSTAAAVGSMPAVKHFLNKLGVESWRSYWVHADPDPKMPTSLLNDPLLAAASTGKMTVLAYILPLITSAMSGLGRGDERRCVKLRVYTAISAAIKGKHISIIRLLCAYCKSHKWKITNREHCPTSQLPYGKLWLKDAARLGCFHTSRAVLIALSALGTETRQHWTNILFISACEHGSTDLVRTMLARNLVETKCTQLIEATPGCYNAVIMSKHGMRIAAALGHIEIVDMLLREQGTSIDDAFWASIEHGRVSLMKHLFQCGAHIVPADVLQQCLSNMRYQGLRSFVNKYQALTYYAAAKLAAEKWPAMNNVDKVKWLIDDVEDSAIWSARVGRVMEM